MRPSIEIPMTRSLRVVMLALIAGAVTFALHGGDTSTEKPATPEITGWWKAAPVENGQRSEVYLHFVEQDGATVARISLPAIRAWDVPIGRVETKDGAVAIGGWSLDRSDDALTGTLPGALVPVHEIEISFHPSTKPEAPSPAFEAPRPKVRWTFDAGAPVWAGIARDAGRKRVLIATDAGVLHALDEGTGKPVWSVEIGASIRARATIAGDLAYVHDDSSRVHAIALDSGRTLWTASLADPERPATARIPVTSAESRWDLFASSVVAAGDRLFVTSRDGRLCALDARSGTVLWATPAGDIATGTPAVAGNLVVFGSFDGLVHAVSADDGKLAWKRDTGAPVTSDIVISDSHAIVGSRSYDLYALDLASGKTAWRFYYWFSWVESVPTLRDGIAYIGSSDALRLFAIRSRDGHEVWSSDLPGWAWAQPALGDTNVYVGTVGIEKYMGPRDAAFVATDTRTGAIRWIHPMDRPGAAAFWGFAASPVATESGVVAADLGGKVYAFAAEAK